MGIIEEVGSGISHIKVGDEVWYYDGGYANNGGSCAQYEVVNGHYVALKSKSLDFVQAAALHVVGLISWEAVYEKTNVKAGDLSLFMAVLADLDISASS